MAMRGNHQAKKGLFFPARLLVSHASCRCRHTNLVTHAG